MFLHFGDRQTGRQADRQTNKRMDRSLSLSRVDSFQFSLSLLPFTEVYVGTYALDAVQIRLRLSRRD